MGLFDKLKQAFTKTVEPAAAPTKKSPKSTKVKPPEKELTEKEKATLAGEPYVNVLRMDVDPNDINSGSFELDYNDKFIVNLIKAGYKYKPTDTDYEIVDRWWTQVCRNVALEVYAQVQADPTNRELRPIQSRDIGNGRTEVS